MAVDIRNANRFDNSARARQNTWQSNAGFAHNPTFRLKPKEENDLKIRKSGNRNRFFHEFLSSKFKSTSVFLVFYDRLQR